MNDPRDEQQQQDQTPEQEPGTHGGSASEPPPLRSETTGSEFTAPGTRAGQSGTAHIPPPPPQAPPPPPRQENAPPPVYGSPPPSYAPPAAPPQQAWQQHPGGPPPWQAQPPRRMRRNPIGLIIGLAVLGFVAVTALIGFIGAGAAGSGLGISLPFGDRIALLEVEGVIGEGAAYPADTKRLKNLVRKWASDDSVKGMVIRVNSPGGAVSATNDLYEAIEGFRAENKPVYASMGDVAASGGYYLSMAADRVYANHGTITGSVGVILSFWGYQELVGKIGLEPRTIKSGEFKDIGNGARDLTEEEKALLNGMVVDVYEDFFGIVYKGRSEAVREILAESGDSTRNMEDVDREEVEGHIRQYADGRIFSGNQALEYGFVDEIGTLDDAVEAMRVDLGLPEGTSVLHTPDPQPSLFGMMKQKVQALDQVQPGMAKLEYRFQM